MKWRECRRADHPHGRRFTSSRSSGRCRRVRVVMGGDRRPLGTLAVRRRAAQLEALDGPRASGATGPAWLALFVAVLWFATLGVSAAVQPRRRAATRKSRARCWRRRLDRSAPERPRLHRETPAAILGDRIESTGSSGGRVCRALVHGALRVRRRSCWWAARAALVGRRRRHGAPWRCCPACCCCCAGAAADLDMSSTFYMTAGLAAFLLARARHGRVGRIGCWWRGRRRRSAC